MEYQFDERELMPSYGYITKAHDRQHVCTACYSKSGAKEPTYLSNGSVNPQALFNEVMRLRYQA